MSETKKKTSKVKVISNIITVIIMTIVATMIVGCGNKSKTSTEDIKQVKASEAPAEAVSGKTDPVQAPEIVTESGGSMAKRAVDKARAKHDAFIAAHKKEDQERKAKRLAREAAARKYKADRIAAEAKRKVSSEDMNAAWIKSQAESDADSIKTIKARIVKFEKRLAKVKAESYTDSSKQAQQRKAIKQYESMIKRSQDAIKRLANRKPLFEHKTGVPKDKRYKKYINNF